MDDKNRETEELKISPKFIAYCENNGIIIDDAFILQIKKSDKFIALTDKSKVPDGLFTRKEIFDMSRRKKTKKRTQKKEDDIREIVALWTELKNPIDKNNLDKLLCSLPDAFICTTPVYNLFKNAVMESKFAIDQVSSKLSLKIREDAVTNSTRLTEKLIETMITQDQEYISVFKQHLSITGRYEELKQFREAYLAKMEAVKLMCKLYSDQYWAIDPTVRG